MGGFKLMDIDTKQAYFDMIVNSTYIENLNSGMVLEPTGKPQQALNFNLGQVNSNTYADNTLAQSNPMNYNQGMKQQMKGNK
jgi:galactokinase/mevalonate kinase-like predicted kinase